MLTNRDSQCRALADLGKVIASAFAFEMKQAYMDVVMKDRDAWNFHERAAKGADMIADWLADGAGEDKEETAAADFARAFLGAGVVNQVAAYPFESVYTSPTRLVMQDAYEAVRQLYHKYGFVKSEDCDLHEDHIALEIQFLAHLSGRAAKFLKKVRRPKRVMFFGCKRRLSKRTLKTGFRVFATMSVPAPFRPSTRVGHISSRASSSRLRVR